MQTRRYETLDSLRGIAALAVVLFHLGLVNIEPGLMPYGYLAVDFFFVLSGFVVAHAYENALGTWLTWPAFVVRRLIRLYPLALVGAMMGLIVLLMKWYSFPSKVDSLPSLLLAGFFNCLMLPTLFGEETLRYQLFPGNGPLWTLFLELVINILWGYFAFKAKTRTLAIFSALAGVALLHFLVYFHTANIGFDLKTFGGGLARICFGFPLGIVIYRIHHTIRIPSFRFGSPLLGAALLLVLSFPWSSDPDGVPWWDIVCIVFILPAIVILGIGQGSCSRLGIWLGNLSYPIYVLHIPILLVASALFQTVFAGANPHLVSIGTIIVVLALGSAALRLYDEPVRRLLSRTVGRMRAFSAPTRNSSRPLLNS